MKIDKLKDKLQHVPRNKLGDPNFTKLSVNDNEVNKATLDAVSQPGECILSTFTVGEVIELVNRCLYQLEYQQRSHLKRAAEARQFELPIKEAAKQLFPGTSWIKLTPEQLQAAMLKAYPTLVK